MGSRGASLADEFFRISRLVFLLVSVAHNPALLVTLLLQLENPKIGRGHQ